MKIYIDANVFIFLAIGEGQERIKSRDLISSVVEGKYEAHTSALVLDEVMWALIKNKKKHLIRQVIHGIYDIPHLSVLSVSADIPLLATDIMEETKLKPRDAFHVAIMRHNSINTIASDDRDFDRLKGIKRIF